MASITHRRSPLNRMGEKGLPLCRQQAVLFTDCLVAVNVAEVGEILRTDRADQSTLVQSQGRQVLTSQVGAADVIVSTGVGTYSEQGLRGAILEAYKKGAVFLRRPGGMAAVAFKVVHMGSDVVLNYLGARLMAIPAAFGALLAGREACHTVAVTTTHAGALVNINTHFQVMFPLEFRPALITHGVFAR